MFEGGGGGACNSTVSISKGGRSSIDILLVLKVAVAPIVHRVRRRGGCLATAGQQEGACTGCVHITIL